MAVPNPINRKEKYLYKIATGGGEIPARPLSREEQYLEAIAMGGGSAEWGGIEGNIEDQTDLANALDGKSTVSVSNTGSATAEVKYITIDGTEYKLPEGGGGGTRYNLSVNATSILAGEVEQMVGAVITIKDAHDNVLGTATYAGTTAVFSLPENQTYKVVITPIVTIEGVPFFNPTATNMQGAMTQNITVNVQYANAGTMSTLQEARAFINAVDLATAEAVLVGEEGNLHNFECDVILTNPANSISYTMTLVADHCYQAKKEDGTLHNGIYWLCKYCLPITRVWDSPEREQATGTFDTDHKYFSAPTLSGNPTAMTAGTDYQVGDSVADYETEHSCVVLWNGLKNNSGVPSANVIIIKNGSNIAKYGNIFQWLNGSGVNWFVKSYDGDVCSYASDHGFLDWWKPEDLACVQKVAYKVVERSGFESENNEMFSYFTLPSGIEIAGTVNAGEGEVLKRWKALNGGIISDAANTNRTITKVDAKTSKQTAWLRSPTRSTSDLPWILDSGGHLDGYGADASGSLAVFPAFTTF